MKKLFLILLAIAVLAACATAPEQTDTAEEAVVVEETASESSESIHAKNSYFVINDPSVVEKLDSVEYKMLINLEDYEPEVLWALMIEAATENNVKVEEEDNPMKRRYRNVEYIDSEYGMLNNFGYILRHRHKFDEFVAIGSSDNVMDDKFDITIKFRDADLAKSLSIPLSVGSAFDDISKNPEMEADISPYGIKYSWAIKVKPKVKDYVSFADMFDPSLDSYAALYPHLLDIGLPADTIVEPVGGLTVLEEKIEPAILVLDCGAEMEVAFSTFFIDGEALVAEVSYDFDTEYKVKDSEGNKIEKKMTLEDLKQAESFYKSILEKYNERLNFGWSKTNFVFDSLPGVGAE
ncbi:MAG: membrane lipoprotein lipid attachment site-containing protein [Spirochaetales bacterium]|nr:membrane lipoprotein lipid attachment site-containing protein [Spirochaetales bacterium]